MATDKQDNINANTTVSEPDINEDPVRSSDEDFILTSSAFENEGQIPARYCTTDVSGGENISIPYSWQGEPKETKSFFFVLADPHPVAKNFIHWVVKSIPSGVHGIAENASNTDDMPNGVIELTNGYGLPGYGGPQPPAGTGPHPYEAYIFALNTEEVEISDSPSWDEIQTNLKPFIMASAKYTGFFGR
ncbi:YbhB/YbcL family Raf kinase inhibitor-like protein [Candidatus Dojkabacteria bacterium]|nr:YbhB/YbcL family Raf kinase inhibitor-like protein [Candidatus Dojkabacteria bacterium]